MREDICSIPVSEVFAVKDGCPICRLYDTLEKRMVDYIMGDAMMEPDVRTETNQKGFCRRHYDQMGDCRAKLAFSLVLGTHIDRLMALKPAELERELPALQQSCFVCEKIEWGLSRLLDTVFRLYETEPEFRAVFQSQPYFCLRHYALLLRGVAAKKVKKQKKAFLTDLHTAAHRRGEELRGRLQAFSNSFDYRADHSAPMPQEVKDSLRDAVEYLTGK